MSTPTRNFINIRIGHKSSRALIDTGAHYSCLNADFAKRAHIQINTDTLSTLPKLTNANGKPMSLVGSATTCISIAGYERYVDFVIVDGLYHNVILGIEALTDMKAVIDVHNSVLSVDNNLVSVPLIQRFSANNILRTVNCVTIEPLHEVRLPVRIAENYTLGPSIIEPLNTHNASPFMIAKAFVDPNSRITVCQMVNLSQKSITLPKRLAVATITPAQLLSSPDNCTVHDIYTSASVCNVNVASSYDDKLNALREKGFNLSHGDLSEKQFLELVDLLYEYRMVFATDVKELPGVTGVNYNITLQPGARPKRQRQYRYPPHLREVIREQMSEWEKAGIIEEGNATWIHPIVLVQKKAYGGKPQDPPKYRACLDLRAINKVMVIESYPIPTFNSIIESFGDPLPTYYSVLDAISGFLQLPVTEESSKLLGLETDSKTYVMKRIPFGLTTSPFVYQKLMNSLLTGYQYVFACAYLDDLLIWSTNWSNHIRHLRLILERILHSGLRLRADKCKIAQTELRYLGMVLSKECIKPDPEKLSVIKNAKPPTNAKLLRSFLGLCNFYRRFIRGYANLCQPFRNLLRKNAPFEWTEKHEEAFNALKKAMTSAPVCLSMPRWNDKIVLTTDASRNGCGYIISCEDSKGVHRVICYGGRLWTKHESMWSVSELEMASILYALETNSQYFIGRHFKIVTDHVSNIWVRNLKHSQGKLYRWSLRLQNFSFDIEHIEGKKMAADWISRVVDKVDDKAPNLDDDSCLVFVVGDEGSRDFKQAEPTVVRPRDMKRRRRQTSIITLPSCDCPHDRLSTAQSLIGFDATDRKTDATINCHPHCQPSYISGPNLALDRDSDLKHIAVGKADKTTDKSCDVPASTSQTDSDMTNQLSPVTQTAIIAAVSDSTENQMAHNYTPSDVPTDRQLPTLIELMNNNDLPRLQRESRELSAIIQYLENSDLPRDSRTARAIVSDADNWCLIDNILYHIHNPRKRNVNSAKGCIRQLAVPETLRKQILTAYHDNSGHWRLDKTYMSIMQHFFWRGLYADLRQHLANCYDCSVASQKQPKKAPLQHAPVTGVLECLVVDYLKLPQTTFKLTGQTVEYCLTLVDRASQWCMLIPTPDCTTKTTALAIQVHWISNFGFPRIIYSDLGTSFTSKLFQELCKTYNIDHTLAASQNHKAVSRAEGLHRVILGSLRKMCTQHTDWADRLPGLLLSLHSSVVTSTGLSPSFMLMHRELRIPLMATLPLSVDTTDKTLSQVVETTRLTDNLIQENTEASFKQADKYYNRQAVSREFQIGDSALLYDEHVPAGVMRKMHRFYRPVEVVVCLPNSCYMLKDKTTGRKLPFKVHVSRLKALVGGLETKSIAQTPGRQEGPTQVPPTRVMAPQQPSPTAEEAWHTITGIRGRRRKPTGQYEYLVEWAEDGSTNWLPAQAISPSVVRQYNARHRRRRQ